MANTATIASAATANGYTLLLELTETGTSAADNTSTVAWRLTLTSGSWSFSQYRVGWSVSLAGAVVSARSKAQAPQIGVNKHSAVTVASGTAAVPHGADGALTMTAAASIDMDAASYTPGPMSLSGSMALTNIPRASALTVASGTLGVAQTLTITRASAAFTHALTYVCGSYSGTIGTGDFTGSGDVISRSWTPMESLAAQNTTGQTVSVTLTLTTYNGSAAVGSRSYTVSMAIPASVKPTASAAVEPVNDNETVSGWGVAVKGFTRLRVTVTGTGARGSAITAYEVRANGQTLTDRISTTARLSTTDRSVKVRVKDSRGRWSDTVTVRAPVIYSYGDPTVTAAEAVRCTSAGQADESGAYLRVRCAGSVYSCGGHNGKTVQCRRRVSGGSWTGWLTLTDGEQRIVNAGLSAASSCQVQLRVSDSLGASRTVTVTVPTASVTLNLRPGGSGAAFGKYAEADGELQSAWALKLTTPLEVASGGTGQTEARSTVTVTPDTSVASAHAVTVRRFGYLGMCFVRGYVRFDHVAVGANTWVTVATVPSDAAPAAVTALAASVYNGGSALVNSAGELRLRPTAALSSDSYYDIYFSGWWTTA